MTGTPTPGRGNEKLRRECGEVFLKALEDSRTIEILLNADGKLWQERLGERLAVIGSMTPSQGEADHSHCGGVASGMTVTLAIPGRGRESFLWTVRVLRDSSRRSLRPNLCDSQKGGGHLHVRAIRRGRHHEQCSRM